MNAFTPEAALNPHFSISDPSELSTFDPQSSESVRTLMPVGTVVDEDGERRLVGVPRPGKTDTMWALFAGASGSGKTQSLIGHMLAAAQVGEGFLYYDPTRSGLDQLKGYLSGYADRVFELDMGASNREGMLTVGWNPLDVTVAPDAERRAYVQTLIGALPEVLFPHYCGNDSQAPQTRSIITNALRCLLALNLKLPPEVQTTIFCMETLLVDDEWREGAIRHLSERDLRWWHTRFPGIVGDKGTHAPALKPILNCLRAWESEERLVGMLGASLSTIRWKEIMDRGGIVLMAPGNPGSESSDLTDRLMYHEVTTAFRLMSHNYREDRLRPFHLFFDDVQASEWIAGRIPDLTAQYRKYGAKGYFALQDLGRIPETAVNGALSNLSFLFMGRLGDNIGYAEEVERRTGIAASDLRSLMPGEFVCRVDVDCKPEAFKMAGIDLDAWAYMRSDENISERVAQNSDLTSVWERSRHASALPERISHWLRSKVLLSVDEVIDAQIERFRAYPETEVPEFSKVVDEQASRFSNEDAISPPEAKRSWVGKAVAAGAAFLVGFALGRRSK